MIAVTTTAQRMPRISVAKTTIANSTGWCWLPAPVRLPTVGTQPGSEGSRDSKSEKTAHGVVCNRLLDRPSPAFSATLPRADQVTRAAP